MNFNTLGNIINQYKSFIDSDEYDELYKWKAIKTFQDNWDLEAKDFHLMLKNALADTKNLLGDGRYFARRMVKRFAEISPEVTRQMFRDLFDEQKDLIERVERFRTQSIALNKDLEKIHNKTLNPFQDMRAVYAYLTLRYPEKYCFYKDGMFREFGDMVNYPIKPIRGRLTNLLHWKSLYSEVHDEILKDNDLIEKHLERLTPDCYTDTNYLVLTQDVIWTAISYNTRIDLAEKRIYKVSHGLKDISDELVEKFRKKRIAVVHRDTLPKVKNGKPQGESFQEAKVGDLFYLCRANEYFILLGEFTSEARPCSIKSLGDDGWLERKYKVLKSPVNDEYYKGTQHWWAPNHNSTFVEIPKNKIAIANRDIFSPFFGVSIVAADKINSAESGSPLNVVEGQKAKVKRSSGKRKGVKTDHTKRQKANQALGKLGELLVIRHEKEKLANHPRLIKKIRHVSVEEGDGLGYDIESRTIEGKKLFIEVKTTTGSSNSEFFITRTELDASSDYPKEYRLYRVFNYDRKKDKADVIILSGDMNEELHLEPEVYKSKVEET